MKTQNHDKATAKIKARSAHSSHLDPYRAGIEIGEALASLEPEVIFLFPTIHYRGSPELVEAIYAALESDSTVLVGCTGDGFYEIARVAEAGVSALALNSGGAVKWHLAHEPGVGKHPREATERCVMRINQDCDSGPPAFYFLTTDYRTDTSQIIAALQEHAAAPVVGGLAGDDLAMEKCFVYANREVLTDSVAMLAAEGPLAFEIRVAHRLRTMGRPGRITEIDGTSVLRIDDIPALEFIEREFGKPLEMADEGALSFSLTETKDGQDGRVLTPLLPRGGANDTSVVLFGGVEEGSFAQVCIARPDELISEMKAIGDSLSASSFDPVAALMISCAGRKKVLGESIETEVREIVRGCPSLRALAGFPSYGEFGPLKTEDGYTQALFHNMTFILLLIGAVQS